MYQIITTVAGTIFVIFGSVNFIRALLSRDSVVTQLIPIRIIISGLLLVLHHPISSWLSTTFQDFVASRGVHFSDTVAFWMAIAVMAAIQCIVLPSWRLLVLVDAIDNLRQR